MAGDVERGWRHCTSDVYPTVCRAIVDDIAESFGPLWVRVEECTIGRVRVLLHLGGVAGFRRPEAWQCACPGQAIELKALARELTTLVDPGAFRTRSTRMQENRR